VMDVRMDGYLQEEECMEGKGRLGCWMNELFN
jgi:hypothetical protein